MKLVSPAALLRNLAVQFFQTHHNLTPNAVTIQQTSEHYEGEYSIVLFPFTKCVALPLPQLAEHLGAFIIKEKPDVFQSFQIVKGFLNIGITDDFLTKYIASIASKTDYTQASNGKRILIEYSSPNTNKPLHLGHLRNNFLGYSIATLYTYAGYEVIPTCVVNDRGIHICKSMLAWQQWGKGSTPESAHKKGDHFVGDYYVMFARSLKEEMTQLQVPEHATPLMMAAQKMLLQWEENDPDIRKIWQQMNDWVYEGFRATYEKIGTHFEKTYYESHTYLLGKEIVQQGLEAGICYKKPDGSVWINIDDDEKLLLRSDGTSVYMTQDLGLAVQKYQDFPYEKSLYIVGDEQNHHFKILQKILEKCHFLNPAIAHITHYSYGMVELTTGKMKSREGTVVDADNIIADMEEEAWQRAQSLKKNTRQNEAEARATASIIAMGALKFFLLRVDPKKKIVFNPWESIDLQGFTGPFLQYTHARLCSLLEKLNNENPIPASISPLLPLERLIIKDIFFFEKTLEEATQTANPSLIAQYIYQLAQRFNTLYATHSFLNAENTHKTILRTHIAQACKNILRTGAHILGITLPNKM